MKANELMLGNWVRRRWTCTDTGREVVRDFQITEIRKNGETLYAWGKSGNMGRVEKLEPIPLTPEILEKNGFSADYCNDDLCYAQSCGDIIGIHIYGKNGCMDEMYFKYVHQLQQALQLCGIEKEITI